MSDWFRSAETAFWEMPVERLIPVIRLSPVPLKKKHRTGSLALSAPFCPRVFLLSVHPSGKWMVGAVGIERTQDIGIETQTSLKAPWGNL